MKWFESCSLPCETSCKTLGLAMHSFCGSSSAILMEHLLGGRSEGFIVFTIPLIGTSGRSRHLIGGKLSLREEK